MDEWNCDTDDADELESMLEEAHRWIDATFDGAKIRRVEYSFTQSKDGIFDRSCVCIGAIDHWIVHKGNAAYRAMRYFSCRRVRSPTPFGWHERSYRIIHGAIPSEDRWQSTDELRDGSWHSLDGQQS